MILVTGASGNVGSQVVEQLAVRALTEDGQEDKAYDIIGPESLSFTEAAERISAVTGREIRHVDVPPEAARQGMLSSGIPEWQVDVSLALLVAICEGALDAVTGTVASVGRVEPRSFEDYAREFAPAFA